MVRRGPAHVAVSPLWPLGSIHVIAPDTGVHADRRCCSVRGGVLLARVARGRGAIGLAHRGRSGRRAERVRPSKVVAAAEPVGRPAHRRARRPLRARPRRFAAVGAGARRRLRGRGVDRGGGRGDRVRRELERARDAPGPLRLELGPDDDRRGRIRQPAARDHGAARRPRAERHRVVVGRVQLRDRRTTSRYRCSRSTGAPATSHPPVLTGRPVAHDDEIVFGSTTLDALRPARRRHRDGRGRHPPGQPEDRRHRDPAVDRHRWRRPHVARPRRGALVPHDGRPRRSGRRVPADGGRAVPARRCCSTSRTMPTEPRSCGASRSANPDGTPGGTYEQPVSRAADIRNYDEMGSLPIALAALLAAAAAIAFLVTLIASVHARRRDLAILRTIGLTTGQIRATVITQTLLTVFVTLAIGIPIGIVVGRVTWTAYARDIGVGPTPTVPLVLVFAIAAAAAVRGAPVRLDPHRARGAHVDRAGAYAPNSAAPAMRPSASISGASTASRKPASTAARVASANCRHVILAAAGIARASRPRVERRSWCRTARHVARLPEARRRSRSARRPTACARHRARRRARRARSRLRRRYLEPRRGRRRGPVAHPPVERVERALQHVVHLRAGVDRQLRSACPVGGVRDRGREVFDRAARRSRARPRQRKYVSQCAAPATSQSRNRSASGWRAGRYRARRARRSRSARPSPAPARRRGCGPARPGGRGARPCAPAPGRS